VRAGSVGSGKQTYRVIAIDGPAASGKSSVARALADRLGFAYVNSGALYRAVTWHVLRKQIDLNDTAAIAAATDEARIVCECISGELRILVDGVDPSAHLRDDEVNRAVSPVSSVPRVREILNAKMRACSSERDVVIEGRDIGSVVFPDTPYMFYLDATLKVRTGRRQAQGERDEISARDRADSTRNTAPLLIASDAEVIDTAPLSIAQVVDEIARRLAAKGLTPVVAATG
jgi:cytidylate kinase